MYLIMKITFRRSIAFMSLVITMAVSSYTFAQQNIAPEELQSPGFDKTLLVGKWKAGDVEYAFEKNGTSVVMTKGKECPGTWVLKNKTVIVNPKKLAWKKDDPCSMTSVLEVKTITADDMQTVDKEGGNQLHWVRQK